MPMLVAVAGTSSFKIFRWREVDLNHQYRGTKAVDFRSSIPGIAGASAGS